MKKKKSKEGRILFFTSCLVLIIISIVLVYFIFYRKNEVDGNNKLVIAIDFSKCTKGTCTYKVDLDNKVYSLKYVNIENPKGEGLEVILSKVYLNNKVIINVIEYDRVLDMHILNDLLVFGKHRGTSPDGQYIEVFNKTGNLVSKINVLDDDLSISPSPYYELYKNEEGFLDVKLADNFYEISNDTLKIYGTRYTNSWEIEIDDAYYFYEDIPELIKNKKLSASDVFSGLYEITYDELINGDNPKLKEIIETNEDISNLVEE